MTFSRPCVPPRLCLCLGPPSSSTQQNCERHLSTFIHPVTTLPGGRPGRGFIHPSFIIMSSGGRDGSGEARGGEGTTSGKQRLGAAVRGKVHSVASFVSGGFSGVLSAVILQPTDVLKTKMQVRDQLGLRSQSLRSYRVGKEIDPSNQPTSSIYFGVGVPSRPHTRTQTKARSRHSLQHKPRSIALLLPASFAHFFSCFVGT